MKHIIDEATGEIVEVEEANDIAEKILYEVGAIGDDTAEFIEKYLAVKEQFEMFEHVLKKAMIENNIKTWKNDYFTVSMRVHKQGWIPTD